MLLLDSVKRMFTAVTDEVTAGPDIVNAINQGQSLAQQSGWSIPAAIVAAHVSATTDFGALLVGDYVVHIPATAGSADWAAVITAGTNPDGTAVVGDLYVVLRAYSLPASVKGTVVL